MPVCGTESLSRVWSSTENVTDESGFHSPASPSSPISTSPVSLKKRNVVIRRASSANAIIVGGERCYSPVESVVSENEEEEEEKAGEEEQLYWLAKIIGWYPWFLIKLTLAFLPGLTGAWREVLVAVAVWWVKIWASVFWKVVQLPLVVFKTAVLVLLTPAVERGRKKRTVLISGGSSVQGLHLARNFYSAGARVIMCEIDGCLALTRFSTAVTKFYQLPRPSKDQLQNYVRALAEIVEAEKVAYYIPVSSATPAYYDAVAKPHLELLGCACFCPGIKEVWALDDTLEVLKRCEKIGLQTPNYFPVTSNLDVFSIYDTGASKSSRFVMSKAGPAGLKDKRKFVLPRDRGDLKLPEITEHEPWVIVQDLDGETYVTCTAVKQNQVIANVTCRLDENTQGLIPVENKQIAAWIDNFFGKLNLLRPVTCHITFKFVIAKSNKVVVPLSSRVGISLPYICYTSVHPRLLWKPCKHFSRQNSGPLVVENGRYWMPKTVASTIKHPSVETVTRLIGTVLDKREVLFEVWDPLPYCVYYHMQLPLKGIQAFLRKSRDTQLGNRL